MDQHTKYTYTGVELERDAKIWRENSILFTYTDWGDCHIVLFIHIQCKTIYISTTGLKPRFDPY